MAQKKMTKREKQLAIKVVLSIILLAALAIFWFVIKPMMNNDDSGNDNNDINVVYDVPEGTAEFHFIDVGQGDSVLIKVGEKNILIDTGKASAREDLLAYLDSHGVTQIEYFVITHFDTDHYGNAVTVLDTYDVVNLLVPDQPKTGTTFEKFMDKVEEQADAGKIDVLSANDMVGQKLEIEELELSILAPLSDSYKDSNDYSVVLMARYGNKRVLLSGDAEKEAEADIVEKYSKTDLDCDIFKLGHHGSSTSSTQALLDLATPTYAVVCCGVDNEYGHPHNEVMERITRMEIVLYRTDTQGSVVFSIANDEITVKTEK